MEKVVYNPIMDKNYIGIVTVLDYETSVRKCLSSVLACELAALLFHDVGNS